MAKVPKRDEFFWCKHCMLYNFFDLVSEDDQKRTYKCQDCEETKVRLKWKKNSNGKIAQTAMDKKATIAAPSATAGAAGG